MTEMLAPNVKERKSSSSRSSSLTVNQIRKNSDESIQQNNIVVKQKTHTKNSQFMSLGQSELDIKSDDSGSEDEEQG